MKKFLLFVTLFSLNIVLGQVTHVDFDVNKPTIVFNSWNSSSTFAKVVNPDPSGINTSGFVGQFTAGGDNTIGIGVIDPQTEFPKPFNLASSPIFKMKVWSHEAITVTLHLENSPDWGNYIEASASVTAGQLNQWVELTFDFSAFTNIFMNNIIVIVGGPNTAVGDTYYFDDIVGPALYSSPGQSYNPANNTTDISIASNLVISTNDKFYDTNTGGSITDFTNKVAVRLNNSAGADVPFAASISGDNKITIDPTSDLANGQVYWYGIIGNVFYADGSPVTGVSSSFTSKAAVLGPINVMLFDFDTANAAIGFQSWSATGFSKISNPDASGINVSSNVGSYTHAGNDSGLENSLVAGNSPITAVDFAETPFIKVKVWVDKPVDVTVRVQNYPDYGQGIEQKIKVTEVNKWVELVYNFGTETRTNLDRLQIYFDRDKSGGSTVGSVYYFDDFKKSNVPPAAVTTLSPSTSSTNVAPYLYPTITSNFQFRNIDDSAIADATTVVELRANNASGPLVPMTAVLSTDKSKITIIPDAMLSATATYWFGIKDNVIEYKENNTAITGLSSTYTTSVAPTIVMYNDFDGMSQVSVTETMGNPAGASATVADPVSASNNVLQWDKGNSWYGWERLHFELNAAVDPSKKNVFAVRVYSPMKTQMMFKLSDAKDDAAQTGNMEITKDILLVNKWQTLYFDTSLLTATSFNHAFIFVMPGDAIKVGRFYIDDFKTLQTSALSVKNITKEDITFYPNPVNDKIYFKNIDGIKNIRIIDLNGREINKYTTEQNELSLKNLSSGFYFMEINGTVKKLIKQ